MVRRCSAAQHSLVVTAVETELISLMRMLKMVIKGNKVWYKFNCYTLPPENKHERGTDGKKTRQTANTSRCASVPLRECKRQTCLALRSNTTYCWHWSSLLFLIVQKCRTRFSLCSNSFRMSEQKHTHTQSFSTTQKQNFDTRYLKLHCFH